VLTTLRYGGFTFSVEGYSRREEQHKHDHHRKRNRAGGEMSRQRQGGPERRVERRAGRRVERRAERRADAMHACYSRFTNTSGVLLHMHL